MLSLSLLAAALCSTAPSTATPSTAASSTAASSTAAPSVALSTTLPTLRLVEEHPDVRCGGVLPTPTPVRRTIDRDAAAEHFALIDDGAAVVDDEVTIHWSFESVQVSWKGRTSSAQPFDFPISRGLAMAALLATVAATAILAAPVLLVAPLFWVPWAIFASDDLGELITMPFIGTMMTWLFAPGLVFIVGLFAVTALDVGGSCAAEHAVHQALKEVGYPPERLGAFQVS